MTIDEEAATNQQGDRKPARSTAYVTVAEVAASFPCGRRGKPVHSSTISRWITIGTKVPRGGFKQLRAIRIGGRWLTTWAWLDDFVAALTPADPDASSSRPPATRSRESSAAAVALDQLGI